MEIPKHTMAGGVRKGAGRKSILEETAAADDYARLVKAKADREAANAERDQIRLRKEAGELYDRDEILSTVTSVIAVFAEQMRALPDRLERRAGLTPDQAELAEQEVNAQLLDLKARLLAVCAQMGATEQ